jgi:hypothetical protein
MATTIVRDGQFRLFFFSRERVERPCARVTPRRRSKILADAFVHLALNVGLSALQLRQAQAIVEAHIEEIQNAWHRHFSR